ncbi:MAG: hypothetical protein Q7S12_04395 [bacterium]|nr:hypothetical protein [bacterium]
MKNRTTTALVIAVALVCGVGSVAFWEMAKAQIAQAQTQQNVPPEPRPPVAQNFQKWRSLPVHKKGTTENCEQYYENQKVLYDKMVSLFSRREYDNGANAGSLSVPYGAMYLSCLERNKR